MFDNDTPVQLPTGQVTARYAQPVTRSAHDVAAEIRRRMPDVGAVKLHKLLYYCQGHHLTQVGRPLLAESLSAWDTGPVVGRLWHEEKVTAARPGFAAGQR